MKCSLAKIIECCIALLLELFLNSFHPFSHSICVNFIVLLLLLGSSFATSFCSDFLNRSQFRVALNFPLPFQYLTTPLDFYSILAALSPYPTLLSSLPAFLAFSYIHSFSTFPHIFSFISYNYSQSST